MGRLHGLATSVQTVWRGSRRIVGVHVLDIHNGVLLLVMIGIMILHHFLIVLQLGVRVTTQR